MIRTVISLVIVALLSGDAFTAVSQNIPAADTETIGVLEKKVFTPSMSNAKVDALLAKMTGKSWDPAVKTLIAGASGLQDRIAAFASRQTDLNVRQGAANVVEALDAAYRTTAAGKQLCALYAKYADLLVPRAWEAFGKDALDPRAVAILVSADPDRVTAWLNNDRDRLRFLLLRVREVPDDTWPVGQIAKHTYQSFLRTVGQVFPAGDIKSDTAGVRIVGQTLMRRVYGSKASDAKGLPKLAGIYLIDRQVYLFRTQTDTLGERFGAFKLDVTAWSHGKVRKVHPPFIRTAREFATSTPKGLAGLPRLQLERAHSHHWIQHAMTAPWWAMQYTPRGYWRKIVFGGEVKNQAKPRLLGPVTPKPGAKPPTTSVRTAPVSPGASTVVILAPQLPLVVTDDTKVRALQLCDQLALRLSSTGKVRVVNRTELARVLTERSLSTKVKQPALGYDAMFRLRVEPDEVIPHAELTLVDLSTGSPLGHWRLDWPVEEGAFAEVCRAVPKRLAKPDRSGKNRLKLRFVGVERTQVRMKSLGLRLENLFREALGSSKDILLVEHIEAGAGKEEALLLLLGFARLGGGRRFTPQADATLELRIAESDAVGRTFQETPMDLAFRLRRAGDASGDWTRFSGKVRDYDALSRKAWKALSATLEKIDADAGRKLLDDLALRRKQALAEVKAAEKVQADLPQGQRVRAQLGHMNAAMKLDPFCEEAAYRRIRLLWELYGHNYTKYSGSANVHELILAASDFNARFPQNAVRFSDVQDRAWLGVRMTSLMNLYKGKQISITRELRVLLDAMKQMVEMSVRGDPNRLSRGCPRFMLIVYRGMRHSGVSRARREVWIDGILSGVRLQLTQLNRIPRISRSNTVFRHHWMHALAAELAAEDDQAQRAGKLVAFVRKQLDDPSTAQVDQSQRPSLTGAMRTAIVKTDNAEALATFDRWTNTQKPIRALSFSRLKRYWIHDRNKPLYEAQKIVYSRPGSTLGNPMSPLCTGGGYLYAIVFLGRSTGTGQTIVRIPLDDQGRPRGKALRRPRRRNGDLGRVIGWDSLEMLPQPKVRKYLSVRCSRFIKGKLYLGTAYSGLLVFDAKTKKWEVIDPAGGLPCWGVYTLHDWKDSLLLCFGEDTVGGAYVKFRYTYNPTNGVIRLMQKQDRDKGVYLHGPFRDIWEYEGKVCGIRRYGLVRNILADKPDHRYLPRVAAKGWPEPKRWGGDPEYTCAWVGQRLFVRVSGGLLEMDRAGKVKDRIFMGRGVVLPGFDEYCSVASLSVPGDAPPGDVIVSDGRYLWFAGRHVIYDPQKRRWYGPLMGSGASKSAIATPVGLWMGGGYFMCFIDREKYIAAARKTGRAYQSEQHIRWRDEAIARLPAVSRARYLLALRKFDEAQDVLEAHLKEHKDDPLALLLMGMVQDAWGRKDLKRAEACYRRLADMKDPKARFTGMYMHLHLLVHQKRWSEAQTLLKRMRSTFPIIHEEYDKDIKRLDQRIHKGIADGKSGPDPGAIMR